MKAVIRALLGNPVLANMLMLIILIGGVFGAINMNREMFPKFSLDAVTVSVKYPGGDPAEIEEAICQKIEEAVDGIEGIKEIMTTASEGFGTATILCEDKADANKVKDEIKSQVDAITSFPVDAENPVVEEVKFRGEVLSLVVWGELPERQLKEIARELKDELLQIKGISQASISGTRDYEISIEISEGKLRSYNLTFADVRAAVAKNGINLPAGNIRTSVEDFRIRAVGRKYQAKDYRKIPILTRPDGTVITLDRIAELRDSFDEDSKVFSFFNGMPAMSINVYKTDKEDAIKMSDLIKAFVEKKNHDLPKTVHLAIFNDQSRMIRDRLNMLYSNGQIGLLLVFISLWLFLDLRLSFWVTMGIPTSLAGAIMIMSLTGCSINMLSLFGMIMVLGLIVDDAIVVGESIYARRFSGERMFDSAINGTAEIAMPVIASVTTTIVAFIPLFAITGVMGKFIRQIPIPVVAALSISLLEALFILPVHLRHLPLPSKILNVKRYNLPGRLRKHVAKTLEAFIQQVYGPFIDWVLNWRYAAICIFVALLMIIFGMLKGGIVKFIFIERTESDYLIVNIEMTPGTPLQDTKTASQKVLDGWRKVEKEFSAQLPPDKKLTQGVYSLIGGSVDFMKSVNPAAFEVNIELLPSEQRNIHSQKLLTAWQNEVGKIPSAIKTKFIAFRGGPGGLPIEIRVKGDSLDTILAASDALQEKISKFRGVYDEQVDYSPGKREFIVTIKPEAYHHGLSLNDIAQYVKGGFYGDEALRIQRDRDDVRVKVRYPEKNGRNSIEYFRQLRIMTPSGYRIPFTSVASIKLEEGPSTIHRVDRKKVIRVEADVDDNVANAKEIMEQIKTKILPKICKDFGVECDTEGQDKENKDSIQSLYIGFPMAMLGIYFIIASMFRSYVQPMVIMTTIPFGLIGGVLGHLLFGRMISLLSMFGMVALAGIVVNDAIVLIEGINARLEAGMPLFEAIREGGKRRFRAIMLTTLTTVAGLMPLILEKSMQAQFLIPMAISIAFGVLFATILTLVLIPCQLAALNDLRRWLYFLWHRKWPSREEVEPRVKALDEAD